MKIKVIGKTVSEIIISLIPLVLMWMSEWVDTSSVDLEKHGNA